jgi:phosphate acetyltransferase
MAEAMSWAKRQTTMNTLPPTESIENHPFDEIHLGDGAQLSRTLLAQDIQLFAAMSGDVNPAHVDLAYAQSTPFHGIIAHGMWGAALISTVIGTEFPGPGSLYMGQSLRFVKPVHIGDTVTVQVSVTEMDAHNHHVTLACRCTNQLGEDVITGSALVRAPTEKVKRPRVQPMQVQLSDKGARYHQLLALTQGAAPITVALVAPFSEAALRQARMACDMGLIHPVLMGPEDALRALALKAKIDLDGMRIVPAPASRSAAQLSMQLAIQTAINAAVHTAGNEAKPTGTVQTQTQAQIQAIMPGSADHRELMAELLRPSAAQLPAVRLSQVCVLDMPAFARPLLMAHTALQGTPGLPAHRHAVEEALTLAHAIGLIRPKVAILAQGNRVDAYQAMTLDAAALCMLAEQGEITGGVLDGPMTVDCALSPQAAQAQGVVSNVAGQADILIAPTMEIGTMLTQQWRSLADAQTATLLLGGTVPVILHQEGDSDMSVMASCALALLVVNARVS